jgi:hypothetical protein
MARLPRLHVRVDPAELELIDAHAAAHGLRRSTAARELVRAGLHAEGVPGGSTPLPPTDDESGAWPAGPELRLELARRLLLEQAKSGSATAAAALERSVARDVPRGPRGLFPVIRSTRLTSYEGGASARLVAEREAPWPRVRDPVTSRRASERHRPTGESRSAVSEAANDQRGSPPLEASEPQPRPRRV